MRLVHLLCCIACSPLACSSPSAERASERPLEPLPAVLDSGDAPIVMPPLATAPPQQLPSLGFARHVSGDLAAFDRGSGSVLARLEPPGAILDVAWDPTTRRALVVTEHEGPEACRVHAVSYENGSLSLSGSSDVLGGTARVRAFDGRTLVMAEELGTRLSLLDATLSPVSASKSLFRPASLIGSLDERTLIALDPNAFVSGADHDALVRVRFDGAWHVETWLMPAPGRPGSRLTASPDRRTLWLLRKPIELGRFELGRTSAADPTPPKLRALVIESAIGSLQGVVFEPDLQTLVAALSKDELGGGNGALALVPLQAAGEPALVDLGSGLESTPWPPRTLAYDPIEKRVLAATAVGIVAKRAAGSQLAPGLAPDGTFDGAELGSPFALAQPSGD